MNAGASVLREARAPGTSDRYATVHPSRPLLRRRRFNFRRRGGSGTSAVSRTADIREHQSPRLEYDQFLVQSLALNRFGVPLHRTDVAAVVANGPCCGYAGRGCGVDGLAKSRTSYRDSIERGALHLLHVVGKFSLVDISIKIINEKQRVLTATFHAETAFLDIDTHIGIDT